VEGDHLRKLTLIRNVLLKKYQSQSEAKKGVEEDLTFAYGFVETDREVEARDLEEVTR
jgi:hypothetical protein